MLDYRKNKDRYKPNELGSLYVQKGIEKCETRPIIYIGGQMEHRCHVLEQTGNTFDPGHNMFNGSWFYDYSILAKNKEDINVRNFADNFVKALDMANIGDIDIVTESCGGLIAANASKDPRIHKIYSIHPPITGTPLANPELMLKYEHFFTKQEKLFLKVLKVIVNQNYGFQNDNFQGIKNNLDEIDLDKLMVIGSTLDLETEKNKIAAILYNMIFKISGYESDGVVIFDEWLFKNIGINYIKEEKGLNHIDAGSEENLRRVRRMIENGELK